MFLFRGLVRRWARKALSALAVAISFSMLLSLGSVALGLFELSQERLYNSPGDLIISTQGLNPTISDSHHRSRLLEEEGGNISAAMPILTVLGKIGFVIGQGDDPPSSDTGPVQAEGMVVMNVGLIGVVPGMTERFIENDQLPIRSEIVKFDGWFEEPGDPFHASNYTSGWSGEMLLDENLIRKYSLETGSTVYLLGQDSRPRSSFVIVGSLSTSLLGRGITSGLVGGAAMVHLGELQYATMNHEVNTSAGLKRDMATSIYLKVSDDRKDPSSIREISSALYSSFPGHMISDTEGRLYRIEEEVIVLEVFAVSVGASSLLIGVLFLSSIMLIELEERRSEVVVLRAIGVNVISIFRGILAESLLIACFGASIGFIAALIGSRALDAYLRNLYGLDVSFVSSSPFVPLIAMGFLVANVILFSAIPAMSLLGMKFSGSLGKSSTG